EPSRYAASPSCGARSSAPRAIASAACRSSRLIASQPAASGPACIFLLALLAPRRRKMHEQLLRHRRAEVLGIAGLLERPAHAVGEVRLLVDVEPVFTRESIDPREGRAEGAGRPLEALAARELGAGRHALAQLGEQRIGERVQLLRVE